MGLQALGKIKSAFKMVGRINRGAENFLCRPLRPFVKSVLGQPNDTITRYTGRVLAVGGSLAVALTIGAKEKQMERDCTREEIKHNDVKMYCMAAGALGGPLGMALGYGVGEYLRQKSIDAESDYVKKWVHNHGIE